MRFIFVILCFLVFAATAIAAPKQPEGTISGPQESAPYAFGDTVTFSSTASNLKGNEYPLIYVACYSVVDNELLYGQLDHPDAGFVLGGGSSEWHTDRDDANCTATLYIYGGKERGFDTIVELDSTAFFAAG